MATQEVQGHPSVDTTEFHFKLVKRLDVISSKSKCAFVNHLAVANTLGVTFIGANDGFEVVETDSIASGELKKKLVRASCQVIHLAVNCDETLLSVSGTLPDKTCASFIYPLNNLQQGVLQESQNVVLSSNHSVSLADLVWNPTIPQMFAACLTDGSVAVAELKGGSLEVNFLPPAAGARCLCWSPKGKQLVVGGEDGKLTQYRPDLKPAKALPAPSIFGGAAAVVNVLWISNFQFGAFYRNRSNHQSSPVLMIINAEKNQPVTFILYEDAIIYSLAEFRPQQFYFHHLAAWNIILISSSNSVDLALLFLEPGGNVWKQLVVGDSSRAEMPLSATNDETFPYGMTVDLSSARPVQWTGSNLPPMPRLLTLSNEGRLSLYNIVNLRGDAGQLCAPPRISVPVMFFDAPTQPNKPPPAAEIPQPTNILPPSYTSSPSPNFAMLTATAAASSPLSVPIPPQVSQQSSMPAPPTPEPVKTVPPETSIPVELPAEADPIPEPEVDDSIFEAAIIEEMNSLNEEMTNLRSALSAKPVKLGATSEMSGTVRRLDSLAEFDRQVTETTASQAEEVAEIRLDVLELQARADETTLLNRRRHSTLANQLRKSEPLDPVTARTIKEILTLKTFIESQIHQIKEHLDCQWEDYQKSCRKEAKKFMTAPFMDDIFKTLDIHKKLLCHQKAVVAKLEKSVKENSLNSSLKTAALPGISADRSMDMTKLSESLSSLNIKRGEKIKSDVEVLIGQKILHAKSCELTSGELTVLLDHFEDADVPQVSNVLRFSEREEQKKLIAERIKQATESAKKKREERASAAAMAVADPSPEIVPVSCALGQAKLENESPPVVSKPKEKESLPIGVDLTPKFAFNSSMFSPVGAQAERTKSVAESSISVPTPTFTSAPVKPSAIPSTPTNIFGGFSSLNVTPSQAKNTSFCAPNPFPAQPKVQMSPAINPVLSVGAATTVQFGNAATITTPAFSFGSPSLATSKIGTLPTFALKAEPTAPLKPTVVTEKKPEAKGMFDPPTTTAPSKAMSQFSFAPAAPKVTTTAPPVSIKSEGIFSLPTSSVATTKSPFSTPPAQSSPFVLQQQSPQIQATSSPLTQTSEAKQKTPSLVSNAPTISSASPLTSWSVPPASTPKPPAEPTQKTDPSPGLLKSVLETPPPVIAPGSVTTSPPAEITPPATAPATPTSNQPPTPPTTSAPVNLKKAEAVTATPTSSPFTALNVKPASGNAGPLFGSASSPATQPSSLFGAASPATSNNLFGGPATTAQTSAGLFGSVQSVSSFTASTTASENAFKPTVSTASTLGSSASVFGAVATTSAPSVFGGSAQPAASSGIFGGTTSTSVFGASATTNVFGSFSQTGSVFASPQSPQSQFGSDLTQTTNLFGSVLGAGQVPPATAAQTNIFGQVTPTKSAFESGTGLFGTPASTSASVFGGTPSFAQSPFGSQSASTSIFGQPTTPTGSVFGGSTFGSAAAAPNQSPFGGTATPSAFGTSAFGAKPVLGQSLFGQSGTPSAFGQTSPSTQPSLFGGSTVGTGAFSSGAFSGGGGAFSTGTSSAASTGFGGSPVFSKPAGGFGSAPVFGGSPTTPAFGASASFGSAPVFGGQKVFGSPGNTGAFGQAQQQPTGFDAMASQNTVGFGSLAQMAGQPTTFGGGFSSNQGNAFGAQPQQQPPSSSFGGSSFSSWR